MIADMELLHPGWHRFSTYMHVCEAADEDSGLEPEWAGVAGRVKVLLGDVKSEMHSDVVAAHDEMRRDMGVLRTQMARADAVAALKSGLDKQQASMDKQQQDVAALTSDVAAMKAVLEQLVVGLPRG